ncbi:hypothetical protein C1H46_003549 [Malus baccata]|uniref:Chromo domain-containing protein n=1 Tax=Malus baccata TaxID=106549 RepID=A0A540NIL6_MALBA|nr:hypothetical protein C1H46_003549 [Malus baccata]
MPLHVITEAGILHIPVAILEKRMVKKSQGAVTEVLVQRQNHSPEDATWEPCTELKTKFPEIVNFLYAIKSLNCTCFCLLY